MEQQTFGILIATHGTLGKGYLNTLQIILDLPEDEIEVLGFEAGESTDHFGAQFAQILAKYQNQPMVILLDLPGGTPANTALRFLSSTHVCIAGFNLPFLLELVLAKMNHVSWTDLGLQEMMAHAASSMVCYNELFKQEELK